MCESDSILDKIPMLSENRECTNELKENNHRISKRSSENLQASSPVYDISNIVNKTLSRDTMADQTKSDFNKIQDELDLMIKKAKINAKFSSQYLMKADRDSLLIKILFIILIPMVLWFSWNIIQFIRDDISKKRERNIESRRLRIMEQINKICEV